MPVTAEDMKFIDQMSGDALERLFADKSDADLKEMREVLWQEIRDLKPERPVWEAIHAKAQVIINEEERRFKERQKAATPIEAQWVEGGNAVVYLPFSGYELANIASMFKAIAPSRYLSEDEANALMRSKTPSEAHPFGVFNSGDWTGVVADRFVAAAKKYADGRDGNMSPEEYRRSVSSRFVDKYKADN